MSKIVANGWRYARCGPINQVLHFESFNLQPQAGQAVVQITHAPLHRLDGGVINGSVLGRHCVDMPPFPRIAGCEGVGVVTHITKRPHAFFQSETDTGKLEERNDKKEAILEGSKRSSVTYVHEQINYRDSNAATSSQNIKEGDVVWVSPLNGTWASHALVNLNHLFKINPLHSSLAAIASNLLTAYQLLRNYVRLKEGQVVLQNGGSSATAVAVAALLQSCFADKHITLITASSPGERFTKAEVRLKQFRHSHVIEYNSKGAHTFAELCKQEQLPEAVLYLNGVGGRYFDALLRCVGTRGHVITYGAQNGIGLFVSSGTVIEKELTLQGHFLPSVLAQMKYEEIEAELNTVLKALSESKLFEYPVVELKSLEELPNAWDETFLSGGEKAILTLEELRKHEE